MSDAERRVEALVQAARAVADPQRELGRRARGLLVESTGLSAEGVELALSRCLETRPTMAEISKLVASVRSAPRAHVILPANVFIAAHRGIALALAQSPHVAVKASRREPHFARLLSEAAPGLFELTTDLRPEPGDQVWAYGGDASLDAIRAALPMGVGLHAQGPGYGVTVIDASQISAETASALADDIVPFDQRGCLSPRLVLVAGSTRDAERLAELTAEALAEASQRVPLGRLDTAELADARAFRDAHGYAGKVFPAGPGVVSVAATERWTLAPVGRNLVVVPCEDVVGLLAAHAPEITTVGLATPPSTEHGVARVLRSARRVPLGSMQTPAFDGPADLRALQNAAT